MDDTRLKRALEIVGELAKDPDRYTVIDSQELDELRQIKTHTEEAWLSKPYDLTPAPPSVPGYAQHDPCDCYECVHSWLGEWEDNCLIVRGTGPDDIWAYRRGGGRKATLAGNVRLETVARLLLHNMIVESGSKDPHLRRFVRR